MRTPANPSSSNTITKILHLNHSKQLQSWGGEGIVFGGN